MRLKSLLVMLTLITLFGCNSAEVRAVRSLGLGLFKIAEGPLMRRGL